MQRENIEIGSRKKKVLILGFGDLGRALVKYYGKYYDFRGMKRSPIDHPPCPLFYQPIQSPELDAHLTWAEGLVFCPAPSADDEKRYQEVYLENMRFLVARIKKQRFQIGPIIMIGSTGIYPQKGEVLWTEDSTLHVENPRQEVLFETEKTLVESGLPFVILRCAGLYGEGKGKFKERLSQGRITTAMMTSQYVHFIHLRDVCEAVHRVILKGVVREVFNVLDNSNIRRKDFYQFLSDLFGLPVSDAGEPPKGLSDRRILNQKLKSHLGLSLRYPKITEYLRSTVKNKP
ncbi:MAG TPA: NAD-dependent epimerase/dehydratase family protein [Nitrospiria bacterium]